MNKETKDTIYVVGTVISILLSMIWFWYFAVKDHSYTLEQCIDMCPGGTYTYYPTEHRCYCAITNKNK